MQWQRPGQRQRRPPKRQREHSESAFFLVLFIIIVNNNIIAVKGLSHKKLGEPLLINSDLLSVSSINPPSTKARIKGGIGKS